jgi:hypothetical protein
MNDSFSGPQPIQGQPGDYNANVEPNTVLVNNRNPPVESSNRIDPTLESSNRINPTLPITHDVQYNHYVPEETNNPALLSPRTNGPIYTNSTRYNHYDPNNDV